MSDFGDQVFSLIPFALILFVGIFVQSAAGFAAGLLIVPALLWCGYSIPEAQVSLLVATIPQNLGGVWSLRDSVCWTKVSAPGLARIAFLPLGIFVLRQFESFSVVTIRQIVGGIVLALTIATIVFHPKPREKIHVGWAFLAFPISGFLQGLVGMGGPAMVFWVQAHDWDTRQTRAFLFSMYLISMFPALGLLYYCYGEVVVHSGIVAACTTPLLLIATYLGLRFGNWLGRKRLRWITIALLLAIGFAGLAAPWMVPRTN